MTDDSHNPRSPAPGVRPSRPAVDDDQSPTIRTTPVGLEPALPDQAAHYVAPQPVPKVSEHKTIDMVPVRLAPEINPRHALTRRLTPLPTQRKTPALVLRAVVAALVLATLIVGTVRLLERVSTSALPIETSVGALPSPAPAIEAPVPAAAAIEPPSMAVPGPEQAASAAAAQKLGSAPASPTLKAAPSADSAPKLMPKKREVWLE
jgi:hypothetical protein